MNTDHTTGPQARRFSPGLTRADALGRQARSLRERAEALGLTTVAEIADRADTCAFNSRSGYEAAQLVDSGGSSKAWAFRNRGAMWLKKGRKLLDEAQAALTKAAGE